METILAEMDRSSVTRVSDGEKDVKFEGTNGKGIGLVAKFSGDSYTTCVMSEKTGSDIFLLLDNGCNGSIDASKRGDQEVEPADSWGMAPVSNSILIDLERFTRFASERFPKK